MNIIVDFISRERSRFENRHNNIFALAFSELQRYYEYLLIINERYKDWGQKFVKNHNAAKAQIKPGTHPVNKKLALIFDKGRVITTHLHLEIESFYLFANILLDKIAKAIEIYFGNQQGKSLKSHRKLISHFEEYTKLKGLNVDASLFEMMKKLHSDITGFRDYQITHIPPNRAARTLRGTTFDAQGQTRMMLNSLYPTENDRQYETRLLNELLVDIEAYIAKVIEFIQANQQKTAL